MTPCEGYRCQTQAIETLCLLENTHRIDHEVGVYLSLVTCAHCTVFSSIDG